MTADKLQVARRMLGESWPKLTIAATTGMSRATLHTDLHQLQDDVVLQQPAVTKALREDD